MDADRRGRPGPRLTLRRARPADATSVRVLVEAAYTPYVERIGRLPRPMAADHAAAIRDHEVWVLEAGEGGEIVGVLELIPAPDHVLIENVAVVPYAHGRGLGRRLLDHAEGLARARETLELRLVTNSRFTENRAMYAHLGYEETGEIPSETTPVVELRKRLRA